MVPPLLVLLSLLFTGAEARLPRQDAGGDKRHDPDDGRMVMLRVMARVAVAIEGGRGC